MLSDFVSKFKKAKSDEEKALLVLDAIQETRVNSKEEILKEISIKDLVTKADLESALEKTKNKLLMYMIGICGVWVPLIVSVICKHVG